ncbi:hypothetical protein LCGC14_2812970 [marine sediment metagenome]|uniref:Uncharacterized protein n=1 Tax=marine sediment metagenome TaxID=412755 RepID=A0A0F8Z660_9ZZZZ
MRTRIELECVCGICECKFIIWNLEEMIGKEPGNGLFISGFDCPNCRSNKLTFDLLKREVHI